LEWKRDCQIPVCERFDLIEDRGKRGREKKKVKKEASLPAAIHASTLGSLQPRCRRLSRGESAQKKREGKKKGSTRTRRGQPRGMPEHARGCLIIIIEGLSSQKKRRKPVKRRRAKNEA